MIKPVIIKMGSTKDKEYRLDRFVDAQANGYGHGVPFTQALMEIWEGEKQGHYRWYVWPTPPYIDEYGKEAGSEINKYFALKKFPADKGLNLAGVAYLKDPILLEHYLHINQALLHWLQKGKCLAHIVGEIDVDTVRQSILFFKAAILMVEHTGPLWSSVKDLHEVIEKIVGCQTFKNPYKSLV
jgi:uncharacterized protein (DUF1810 family)